MAVDIRVILLNPFIRAVLNFQKCEYCYTIIEIEFNKYSSSSQAKSVHEV